MTLVKGSERIVSDDASDPAAGEVRWSPKKSLWIGSMMAVTCVFGPSTVSTDAFGLFLVLTALTLCAGHSVGMHRRLIHSSFDCPLWLEYVLVYLGVLVGMAGPIGMIRQHDLRDWAQRQTRCHDYLCHRRDFWRDAYWQLHCDLELRHPPRFVLEPRLARSRIYEWLERTWMWQQAPVALLLYALGGFGYVVWGVAARVFVGVTGHWLVGHFAHRAGPMTWRVRNACVQGHNLPLAAILSMGESWHNNHHAFPGSARLGLTHGQCDPGWRFIQLLRSIGFAWDIRTPETLPARSELERLTPS